MRGLSIFLLLLIIGSILFAGANMMRCINSEASPCPKLCFQKQLDCRNDTSGSCETKQVCRAPDANQYKEIISKYLRELKYKLQANLKLSQYAANH